jgi:hypothetical protein
MKTCNEHVLSPWHSIRSRTITHSRMDLHRDRAVEVRGGMTGRRFAYHAPNGSRITVD